MKASPVFFDDQRFAHFFPLTLTRPLAEMRCGILTNTEKWQREGFHIAGYHTAAWLRGRFPDSVSDLFINGRVHPDMGFAEAVQKLNPGDALVRGGLLLACKTQEKQHFHHELMELEGMNIIEFSEAVFPEFLWDLFGKNDRYISNDFGRITGGRTSAPLSATNRVIGKHPVFLEPGARVEMAIFNTEAGPIYIGEDAEVMEMSVVRGPFAMLPHSTLKMGAKIYGATTLGPHCKAGGEINNSIMMGYSNKAHDGFLGNSVIGEWCNLGADTNNSNLKNNYGEVKIWSMEERKFIKTGLTFCGLIMGDHSKAGINTMFNTGTVVGVCANIFDSGFPPKFVRSFSWGGFDHSPRYELEKAFETARAMYARRGLEFGNEEQELLLSLFEMPHI
jgi:UDP-N-acetylglucosamine diphosphorylase/glucosamine-1-phosphate N-acetyltransferase